ncbi:MAG: S41 family peptidase [Paraclostridium sp.]|uniref:S41 family peptidase n=1 Tax=Paraclostridium sp. TaxID=2023273 RepID=UPI003F416C6C
MKFKILTILIMITLITVGCTSTSTLSEEEKLADFEQLYNEIKDGYPFLEVNKRQNKVDWLANKESYKEIVMKTLSDQDFADKLNYILKDLNSGHTEVVNEKAYFDMLKEVYEPLGWYDFFDDENVNNMYNSLKKGGGYGSESYKDIEMKDLVEGEIGYIDIPQMNAANGSIDGDMKRIDSYLKKRQDYKSLVIDIRGNFGGTDEYWTKLVSTLTDKSYECGGYRLVRNTSDVINNFTKARNTNLNDISELPKDIIKNAPEELTSMFTHFEYNKAIIQGKSKTPFKGRIYLLVDDYVYSGAESFSIFCKEQKFATIVGTKTGGDGYVYDPVLFKLNNSGLIVRMSSTMYLTDSGICNEEEKTTPDIKLKNASGNNAFGLDNCINKVLELENQ